MQRPTLAVLIFSMTQMMLTVASNHATTLHSRCHAGQVFVQDLGEGGGGRKLAASRILSALLTFRAG